MSREEVHHVWFATRRRKWLLQGEVEDRIKSLLLEIANRSGITVLALETMVDHVHVLIRLHDGQTRSGCVHRLKGASARRIFQEMPLLKLDARTEHFWQKRFGSKMVPPQAIETVRRYIETQKERPEKYARF